MSGKFVGNQNDDKIAATYSTVANPGSKVGSYAIVPAAVDTATNDLDNYTVHLVKGKRRVTMADLPITADDQTKVYGAGNPTLTGKVVGIQNDDKIAATYSTVANPGSKVGSYAIVPAAVDTATNDLDNYTVHLVNGTLRVTKADLTITADDQTKVYEIGSASRRDKVEVCEDD